MDGKDDSVKVGDGRDEPVAFNEEMTPLEGKTEKLNPMVNHSSDDDLYQTYQKQKRKRVFLNLEENKLFNSFSPSNTHLKKEQKEEEEKSGRDGCDRNNGDVIVESNDVIGESKSCKTTHKTAETGHKKILDKKEKDEQVSVEEEVGKEKKMKKKN
jgi:hypothetical protein